MICGGGQVCGILMLLSALVAVLVLSVCVTGSYFARRRRQNILALHAANTAAAGGAAPGMYRPASQALEIPPDQLESLRVRAAAIPEGEDPAESMKECPICLDTVALHPDTWAVFPCTHGCCRPCLGDLMRLSSRRVNSNTLAVLCPLCRKIAVAPENTELESGGGGRMGSAVGSPPAPSTPALASPLGMEDQGPSPAAPSVAENAATTDQQGQQQGGAQGASRWNIFNNRGRRWM